MKNIAISDLNKFVKFYNRSPVPENLGIAACISGGLLDGSIIPVVAVKGYYDRFSSKSYVATHVYLSTHPRRSVGVRRYASKYEGGFIQLVKGYHGEPVIKKTTIRPKDCFGAEYAVGKIVAYRRLNMQVFGVIESINKLGRIKLKRIHNQDKYQKYDYINHETTSEHFIVDSNLLDKLMLLRLKN